jgi:predicted ArsR family transcriptional regulator
MITTEEVRALTDRQREVLSIVVENKLFKGKETNVLELAEQLGVAPAAVYRHLVEIEKSALLRIQILPSEKGTQIYERLRLNVQPRRQYTSEALNETRKEILRFLQDQPGSTLVELSEELGINDRTIYHHLRVLEAVQLIARERSRATKRGVPPFIYDITDHGRGVLQKFST